jgi:Secretion system C-terminal sorting domain
MGKKVVIVIAILVNILPGVIFGQGNYNFYISNSGSDNNPGTSAIFPRKTISGTSPLLKSYAASNQSVALGLKSDNSFNETLTTSYPITVGSYSEDTDNNDFAIMNGSKIFDSGWVKIDGTNNTYEQGIPYSGFNGYGINGVGSYSYIYVTETDRSIENTQPFTARKPLQFVTNLKDLENTPGSFYSPVNTTENPKQVYVHTSNDSSPNGNLNYSYEVTIRDFAINSTYQAGNNFQNLWVHGYGAGIGMLPGGANSYYNKIIFGPGAGVHHLVVRSGIINHSLFLPSSDNTSDFAVVFYDTEGSGRHCAIKNTMFLDINIPVYSHTSGGTNFGAVEMDTVVAFSKYPQQGGFMFTSDNDSVFLNDVYADGYLSGYNYGTAKYVSIRKSCFKDVRFGVGYSATNPVHTAVDNVLIKTGGSNYTSGIYMQNNTSLQLTHSIIHINNSYRNYFPNAGAFIYGSGTPDGKVLAMGNIFICDIDPSATLMAASANTDNGIGTSKDTWSNNVYILLRGNKINWLVTNPATNGGSTIVQDFDNWKKQSGQDTNSLFFDLRNDPRGLKAIFADPDNGNYDLADTPEGNKVAALLAGMTEPVTCFLQKPSYETAAAYVRNNEVLSDNTCRDPCHQSSIRVSNSFTVKAISETQVRLEWNISEQQNTDHYEILRAVGNSDFNIIQSIPVNKDSIYSFVDNVQPGITYQYRLGLIAKAGSECYSGIRSIRITEKTPFIIYPDPAHDKILVSLNGYTGKVSFTISDLNGNVLLTRELFSLYTPQEFELSTLPRGIYLLKVQTSNGVNTQKFVLQ